MDKTHDVLIELMKHVHEKLNALSKKLDTPPEEQYHSKELNELFGALAKAQGEMSIAKKTSVNPYFKSKYANLKDLVVASRPALSKHGLCIDQSIIEDGSERSFLITVLGHSSGQWKKSKMRIRPPKADIQSLGSYISYLKRYAYGSIIGVVSEEEDDDGERAMEQYRSEAAKGTTLNRQYPHKKTSAPTITKEQLEEIRYELKEYPDIAEDVLTGFAIRTLGDMPKDKFQLAINRIREIKRIREK